MTYDEDLANRIRGALGTRDDLTEKRMFGGLAFLIGGHMAVAASGQGGLLVRCDPAMPDDDLAEGVEPMVMRGKPLSGWLRVAEHRVADDSDLQRWVTIGSSYAAALPPK